MILCYNIKKHITVMLSNTIPLRIAHVTCVKCTFLMFKQELPTSLFLCLNLSLNFPNSVIDSRKCIPYHHKKQNFNYNKCFTSISKYGSHGSNFWKGCRKNWTQFTINQILYSWQSSWFRATASQHQPGF